MHLINYSFFPFRDLRFLQQDVDNSRADDEQPAPSRRKRQPSLSETMPLYTLCKEDLDSMDREVRPGPETLCSAGTSVTVSATSLTADSDTSDGAA